MSYSYICISVSQLTLLDSEYIFHNCKITSRMYKGVGGREAGVSGGCRQLKVGYNFHQDTGSSAVSLVRDRNRHSPQDQQRWLLAVVWHYSHPYQCHPEASRALQCTFMDLQSWHKPSVKADFAIFSHVLGILGQCQCVALMLGNKMDFSSCAILDRFS